MANTKLGSYVQVLQTLDSAPPEQKIKLLNEIANWPLSCFAEMFDDIINVTQKYLADGTGKPIRSAALTCSFSLLKCCKTQYHLGQLLDAIAPKVHALFSSHLEGLQLLIQVVSPDTSHAVNLVKQQRDCVVFFQQCLQTASQIPQIQLASLHSLVEDMFDTIQNAMSKTMVRVTLLKIETVFAEANLLFEDARNLLQQFLSLLPSLCASLDPSKPDTVCTHKKRTESDTLAVVCLKLMKLGEISGADAQLKNWSWKIMKDFAIKYCIPLQQKLNVGVIIDSLANQTEIAWDECLRLAPKEGPMIEGDQGFQKKTKVFRFFITQLRCIWEKYATSLVCNYPNLVSFLVRNVSKLPPSLSLGTLSPTALQAIESTFAPHFRNFMKILFSSSPNEETKCQLLQCVCNDNQKNFALGKLVLMLEIFEYDNSTSIAEYSPQAVQLAAQKLKCLPSVAECLRQSYSHLFANITRPFYYKIFSAVAGLILRSFAYHDIKLFLEIESFLVEQIVYPHYLSHLLVSDLWVFLLSNCQETLIERHIDLIGTLILSLNNSPNVAEQLIEVCRRAINKLPDNQKDALFHKLIPSTNADIITNPSVTLFVNKLPLSKFPESIKKSISQTLVPPSIEACGKWLINETSITKLQCALQCLVGVFTHESLVESYIQPSQRQRVIDIILQMIPKTQLYSEPKVMTNLIYLASSTLQYIPFAKQVNLLGHLCTLPASCPDTKLPIATFLEKSAKTRPDPSLKNEFFNKYLILWHTLLVDSNWVVCTETMRLFKKFIAFAPFPVEILTPEDCTNQVVAYMEGKPFQIEPIYTTSDLLHQESKNLLLHAKKRKAISQKSNQLEPTTQNFSMQNGNTALKHLKVEEDPVRKGVRVIREGFQYLNPLPNNMSKGTTEWLKQEMKSIRTLVMNAEEVLHGSH